MNEIIKQIEKEDSDKDIAFADSYNQAMSILKVSRDDKFKIKARVDLEKLLKEKIYTTSLVQFKFSNNMILLVNFALQETTNDLIGFFTSLIDSEFVEKNKVNFTLTHDYPPKNITASSKTIYQEKLYPYVIVSVNFFFGDGKVCDPPLLKTCYEYLQTTNSNNYGMINNSTNTSNTNSTSNSSKMQIDK